MTRASWIFLAAVFLVGVFGTYWYEDEIRPGTTRQATSTAGVSNPASVNCVRLGGTLEISQDASGGAAGYCHLKDGRVCEEWSLLRGGCAAPSTGASTP